MIHDFDHLLDFSLTLNYKPRNWYGSAAGWVVPTLYFLQRAISRQNQHTMLNSNGTRQQVYSGAGCGGPGDSFPLLHER
ncbi:hypothetical protein EYF80_019312 [Liparis tanakae]|uniref:Uncharacterized protein n=1 Tax=Liparis tanakae TaxID=230148 RepID=A0A4Z2HYN7_9TELE|nr:hypothetical protein EYF80_019312 [Liparis tanakae]